MLGTKFLALMLAAALNPLVVRTAEPHGNIPAECEVADRPAMPRVQVADEEAAPLPAIRPASSPKYDVSELDRALATNDRAAFDAALAEAREAGAPTRRYDDIARLWDAQFESPFFAQDSDAYRIASNYPGYEEAMRRHVFTDASGRKFYPAAETRAFVAGRALPIRRASSSPPSPRSTTATRPPATTTRTPTTRRSSRPKLASSRKPASPKPVVSREPAPPSRSPDPSAPQQPATTAPAPAAPSPVVDTSSTEAPPAAGSLETAAPPAPVTTPDTTTTEPAPSTTTAPEKPASKGRPIVLPAILILIGLGVLILLFRTRA